MTNDLSDGGEGLYLNETAGDEGGEYLTIKRIVDMMLQADAAHEVEVKRLVDTLKLGLSAIGECRHCAGEGVLPDSGGDGCPYCGGTGLEIKSRGIMLGEFVPTARAAIASMKN